MVRSEHWQVV
ncbi:hypothetical protein Zm00014a_026392 [Zea mays]|uniref:Uncharacterized protein n=1 Tax=Zea mays TaxID=4577 RepID=A0A3L6D865_MAIZE|nr:hypothetical protein Zm00014a_026392 [Zea mays]